MIRTEPKTPKGVRTREKLIEAAKYLFYTKNYSDTSIHQITQEAGVSAPSFYQYFFKKEDVLFEIITTFADGLFAKLKLILKDNDSLEEKIYKFYLEYFTYVKNNRENYKIFRETEFVGYPFVKQYYLNLSNILIYLMKDNLPEWVVTEDFIYNLIGSTYFITLKKIDWENGQELPHFASELSKFVMNGINNRTDYKLKSNIQKTWLFDDSIKVSKKQSKSEETKQLLLQAAENLFGQYGYEDTHISDVTRKAEVGQGTFYLYYHSKLDILKALVTNINRELRYTVYQYIVGLSHRNDIEVGALIAFSEYIKNHRDAYRVVREAEFIDRELGKWYYNRIAEPYAKALKEAMDRNEINYMDSEILSLGIMGIGHVLGLRWVVWGEIEKPVIPEDSLRNSLRFVLFGVINEEA